MAETDISALVAALKAQTDAINRLVDINAVLIQTLAEQDGADDGAPSTFLDGTPVR